MLFSPSTRFLLSTALLSTPALSAPTRTNCQCILLSTTASTTTPNSHLLSTAPWLPPNPSDVCSSLGPKLEMFRTTQPDLFNAYLRQANAIPVYHDDSPTVHADSNINAMQDGSMKPLERIICRSNPRGHHALDFNADMERDHITGNDQPSFFSLWTSQIIIAIAVLACVAEGLLTGVRWLQRRTSTAATSPPPSSDYQPMATEKHRLQLPGTERRLLALPIPPVTCCAQDSLKSPDAERKSRAYESMRYFVSQASCGRKEFIAYDSEDDDEAGRPVM